MADAGAGPRPEGGSQASVESAVPDETPGLSGPTLTGPSPQPLVSLCAVSRLLVAVLGEEDGARAIEKWHLPQVWDRTGTKRPCPVCGKLFRPKSRSHGKRQKYCSQECHLQASRVYLICDQCGKGFWRQISLVLEYKTRQNNPLRHGNPRQGIYCSHRCHSRLLAAKYGFGVYPEHAKRDMRIDVAEVLRLRREGLAMAEIANRLGWCLSSIYRVIRKKKGGLVSDKLYLKAPTSEAWFRAMHHFKKSRYHVEVGQKFTSLAVFISADHQRAADHIINLFKLAKIDEAEFKVGQAAIGHRQIGSQPAALVVVAPAAATPTPAEAPEAYGRGPQATTAAPRPEIPNDGCLCGTRFLKPKGRSGHLRLCQVWKDFLAKHRQRILEDSLSLTDIRVTKLWHIGVLSLKKMQLEAGLIKAEELSLPYQRALGLKPPSILPPAAVPKTLSAPALTNLPEDQIVSSLQLLIDRQHKLVGEVEALREENKGLKKLADEQATKLRLLKKLIGEG